MSWLNLKQIVLSIFLTSTPCFGAIQFTADADAAPPAKHGMDAIVDALTKAGNEPTAPYRIVAGLATDNSVASELIKEFKLPAPKAPESFLIRRLDHMLLLAGADPRGLMYAELDVADRIGWSNVKDDPFHEVHDTSESPNCPERAVSVYTMQRAYFEQRLYDPHYWDKYFDMLAKDRFNGFVLIFGYENGGFLAPPYPYFFNVEGFDNVSMVGITPEQQHKNLAALNRLIQQAHDRGIDVTIGIWDHIYRGGVQANGVPGTEDALKKPTPGLVWGVTAENLILYTKAALTKFLREVHGIDAIQFRMHDESGLKNSEQGPFWHEIALMMQKEAPNIRFDARAKGLPDSVIDDIVSTGIPFRVTTKYWMEQMGMPWHPTHINPQDQDNRRHSYADLLRYPRAYKMHWRLWNGGTSRVLLWGDPEYVRRFVESTHLYDGDGFEINEPLCTKMQGQAQDVKPFDLLKPEYKYTEYEFERYWYQLMLFGRLGYNPKMASEVWDREFEKRFGKDAGPHIEKALNRASWILPRIVAACYPYSAFPMTRGWAERQSFGDLSTYAKNQGSDVAQFASVDEALDCLLDGKETAKVRPQDTAHWLMKTWNEVNSEVNYANRCMGIASEREFDCTVTDLRILSDLACFHADRIAAATEYRWFQRTGDTPKLWLAVQREESNLSRWHKMADAASRIYTSDLMFGNRTKYLCGDWHDEIPVLEKNLADLKQELRNAPRPASPTTKPTDAAMIAFLNQSMQIEVQHHPIETTSATRPLTVRAKVRAGAGIKWVRLRCRSVNQRLDFDTIAMTVTSNPDEYQAIVPADKISPKFDFMYYIEAMDKGGVGCIWPDFEKQTPYIVVKLQR